MFSGKKIKKALDQVTGKKSVPAKSKKKKPMAQAQQPQKATRQAPAAKATASTTVTDVVPTAGLVVIDDVMGISVHEVPDEAANDPTLKPAQAFKKQKS